MRTTLAALALAGHGLIHLIGFVVPFGIAQLDGFPYRTAVLGGALDLGDAGARLVGVAWLLLAVGFVIVAVATWRGASWSRPVAAALAAASIAVCVLGLPEAGAGIVIDAAILGAVAWSATTRRVAPAAIR
jgi:hypothetical protein